jgi:hypothetical protein
VNTPAHVVVNLLAIGRTSPWPVALGAVAPDLPMLLFYGIEKLVLGTPERIIWGEAYFAASWQALFDAVHSLPLVGLAAFLAWLRGFPRHLFFFSSMTLHSLGDFLLHHDDAHRHFFPIWDWRFESPVSYWDPRHYGNVIAPVESVVVLAGSLFLLSHYRDVRARILLGALVLVYALYVAYALLVWS